MEAFIKFLTTSFGLVFVAFVLLVVAALRYYKRCPSNKILVIYGKVGGGKSAKCIHGGGSIVIPLIQDSQYMSLQPIPIEIKLTGALSQQNIRVNTPSTFTVAISTEENIMLNAAERLLGLTTEQIALQAEEIILGQLRLVIATLTIEEINRDRETFLKKINQNVATELHKVGLDLINVNIRDITDESGYIEAIGKKSAAEAINKARVEVAEQERIGSIGVAKATREKEVQVALETAETEKGKREAEKNQRIATALLETEGATAEAKSMREKDVEVANQLAEAEIGKKRAEAQKRTATAESEALAVEGENIAKIRAAESNALLAEKNALAFQRSEVAKAQADTEVLKAQRERESAKLQKEELVKQEIEKLKIQVEAEAAAERTRAIAKGEADATLAKYQAEAEGLKKLLEAKADGYKEIINACQSDPKVAATLLMIEKIETLVEKQVEAISKIKIDKITVWDSGSSNGEGSSTSNFIKSFITSLPPLQEIAKQSGVELPAYLGTLAETNEKPHIDGAKK